MADENRHAGAGSEGTKNEGVRSESAQNEGAPKASERPRKKKITAVFHKQNSMQNSLKSRGNAAGGPHHAGRSAAGSHLSRPSGSRPARPAEGARQAVSHSVKPETVPSEKAAARAEKAKTEPSRSIRAEAAKTEVVKTEAAKTEVVKTEAARTQAAKAEPEKPSSATQPAEPVKTRTTSSAETAKSGKVETEKTSEAGQSAAASAAKTVPGSAAEQKPAEEKPVRRFVDMEKVRAADRAEKNRMERARNQAHNGRGGQGGGYRGGQGGGYRGGQGGGYRGGQSGGYRGGQGGGFRSGQGGGFRGGQGGPGNNHSGQGSGFHGGQGGRGGQSGPGNRGGQSGFGGGFGMGRNGAQGHNAKNQAGHRFNRKDSDELRRPAGKGKGGLKDLTRPEKPAKQEKVEPEIKMITLPEMVTIRELAEKMKLSPSAIVKKLFLQGKVVTLNQEVDYETASNIAVEFDVLTEKEKKVDVIEELLKDPIEDKEEDLVPRPPVVCVMGHVDHGKTSLLDAIRKTNVTSREAGGITQAIGASVVNINGKTITFLDTPGHEAFTAMRMRGAQATDIAILVVAADDGVMPQTIEAINHAKAAGVEIIVAINKIDKPGANVERVMQELTEYGLVSEEWGGKNIFVPVSAKTGEGIDNLLESILLVAEVMELKANPNRNARGVVIEARLDKGRGPVATVLVQKGTLHVGDDVAAGACHGRIRAMINDKGRRVKQALPSEPVELLGLNDVPNAGEIFNQFDNEKDARAYADTFIAENKKKLLDDTKMKLSLDDLFSQIKAGNVKELDLIIKADVQGSVEALRQSFEKLSNDEVVVKVIHGGVGAINESDVSLASASNAIIIGFNVRPDAQARSIAEHEKVDVRLYNVIYQAIEDVESAMKGMLEPIYEERVLGHAVVRQTFKASAVGTIAGAYVLDGKIVRGCKCRVSRNGEQLFDGKLASLKRFKDDVKEVVTGFECGLVFEDFNDVQEDDTVEAYDMVEVKRE